MDLKTRFAMSKLCLSQEKLSSPIYFVNKWIAARLTPSEGYFDIYLLKKSSAANACEI